MGSKPRAAKRPATEEALASIRSIRTSPESYDLKRDLAPFLHQGSNHVIAAAAEAAKRLEAAQLAEDLIAGFLALLPKAGERDPGCKALTALAEALATMGEDAGDVYLKGIRHVQMEGSYGPPVDAAAHLRGVCARGLVRMRHPEALYETVTLLADSKIAARVGAVAALGDSGSREAELLLRLKVLQGDQEEVMAECFSALMVVAPERSVGFVARELESGIEERVEAAALALGESRLPAALPFLLKAWARHGAAAVQRTLLLSIAMVRQEEGVKFLLARLADESMRVAQDALEALKLYQSDENVRGRVGETVRRRNLRWDWAP